MPEAAHADQGPSSYAGAILHAARPRTLPAAATPVLVGTALAYDAGAFALLPATGALVCALLIQIGTNFVNDYFDYEKGADTGDRVGETRVTQAGLAEPDHVKRWGGAAFGLALLAGVYLVSVGGWPILAIGVASIAAAILYTGGPWPYGYHGLGDLFVFVFFGLVAVGGTYYLQAGTLSLEALLVGAGVGALATTILVVNNLRDVPTDRAAGKRTLAVILGPAAARVEYAVLVAVAFAVPPVGILVFDLDPKAFLAMAAVLPAFQTFGVVQASEDPEQLDAQLPRTARVLALYGLLMAVGVAL
jgi:1,4-dihydroxy-2-naphthoate octaprenyltransferase